MWYVITIPQRALGNTAKKYSSLAHDKGLHGVLINSLSTLLDALNRPNIALSVKVENITLIR